MATTDQPSTLVKYCSMETGLKILNSQSLRWSAPNLFNDPFEPDYRQSPNFNRDELLKALIKEALTMLFGPREPTGMSNRLVAAVSRWRQEERFSSEEEAEKVLTQLLSQVAEQQQQETTSLLSKWQTFAKTIRICCFSDKANNMQAWQHYGDNHQGIALKFSCGEDSTLHKPYKVNYSTTPPAIITLRDQVDVVYGKTTMPKADQEYFLSLLLSKNRDNSSEQEYRCFLMDKDGDNNDSLWYAAKPFKESELRAVLLGLATAEADRSNIISLVKSKYPSVKLFQAVPVSGKYELDFTPV